MKIALISSNRRHLEEMGRGLEAESHTVILVDGGPEKMRAAVERDAPDLMLVDGQWDGRGDLDLVEYINVHHPKTIVILLCPAATPEFLLAAMRAGVREVLPSPVPALALQVAVNRLVAKAAGGAPRSKGRILAFMSCKGGSGATFLATNLGYQLAETQSVLLIDLNLQFGDALSFVHDGTPASTLADVASNIHRLDGSFLAASTVKIAPNFSILAAPEEPSQAVEIKPSHIDAILNLAVTQYDFVLLDVGRSVDPLSVKALDHAHRIYPVLQAGLPYLRNARKLLSVFASLGYPVDKAELIVNRFDKRGEIGIDDMRRLLGQVSLHTVPNSYKDVSASINQGNPLIKMARSSTVTRILADFSRTLNPQQDAGRGLFGRIFRRA